MKKSKISTLLLAVALSLLASTVTVAAAGTPTPTPTEARSGRLGGTLDEMQARFGQPDWTDVDLIGYNAADLGGVETILVVYFDAENIVNKLSMVYLEKPEGFAKPADIAKTVAEVVPTDGTCSAMKMKESGLGTEVYECQSKSLTDVYDAEELKGIGVKGKEGGYSYSVDPTVDDYFEVIIQFGSDSVIVTPTPVPTPKAEPTAKPLPTATASLADQYPYVDIRELETRPYNMVGQKVSFSGTIMTIGVAAPGREYVLGDLETIRTDAIMQVSVEGVYIVVGYDGDTSGMYEGTWVTVYGTVQGTHTITNAFGGQVTQPLVEGTQVFAG